MLLVAEDRRRHGRGLASGSGTVRAVPRVRVSNEDKRARERAKEAGLPKGTNRKAPGKLVEGGAIQGWERALQEFSLHYPDRFTTH